MIKNKNHRHFLYVAVALLFILGMPLISHAQYNQNAMKAVHGKSSFFTRVALGSMLSGSDNGDYHPAVVEFYKSYNNRPFWMTDANKESADKAITLLEHSWIHGLNPDKYHAEELRDLHEKSFLNKVADARLDILLTNSLVEYVRDISGMRVQGKDVSESEEYWRTAPAAQQVIKGLTASDAPLAYVKSQEPKGSFYTALQKELVALTKAAQETKDIEDIDFEKNYFFPNERHPAVLKLRARLGVKHDSRYGPEGKYDDELAAAVIAFQRENDLKPDGIIGPNTLAMLNLSHTDRIKQVIANMERVRWMKQDQPARYVLVNIPSQKLQAVEDGRVVHEMNVVVGLPYRQTTRFSAEITGVRFNPEWTIPLNLKVNDYLPKLQEDPYSLAEKGIRFVKGYGREAELLDPGAIDWNNMTRKRMNEIRMIQSSGDHNALGRIRILMPNKYNIYLHDTNHRELFNEKTRTYSSGCIRLSDPRTVANFILGKNPDWRDQRIDRYLETTDTVEVDSVNKIPVFVVYQTMWLDNGGNLVYGIDVYNKDKKLMDALTAMSEYKIHGSYEGNGLGIKFAQDGSHLASTALIP